MFSNVSDSYEFVKPTKITAMEDPITTLTDIQAKQPQGTPPPTPNQKNPPAQPEEPQLTTTTLTASKIP